MNDPRNHADEIQEQLDKMLSHKLFRGAKRSCSFLRYVSDKVLSGQCYQIKEFSIAVDAFGLETTFDQQIDPRIRVEAKRLRDRLSLYYRGPGRNDSIIISMTKGSYIPEFLFNSKESDAPSTEPLPGDPLSLLIDSRFNISLRFFTDDLPDDFTESINRFLSHLVSLLFKSSSLELSALSLSEIVSLQDRVFSMTWEFRFFFSGDTFIQDIRLLLDPSGTLIQDWQLELNLKDLDNNNACIKTAEGLVRDLLEFCRRLKS